MKLETSSKHVRCQVATCFESSLHNAKKEQLSKTRDRHVVLKHNQTSIIKLGICKVQIKHKNKKITYFLYQREEINCKDDQNYHTIYMPQRSNKLMVNTLKLTAVQIENKKIIQPPKLIPVIGYFPPGPNRKADKEVSNTLAKLYVINHMMISQE